jgi:hypothetical protein
MFFALGLQDVITDTIQHHPGVSIMALHDDISMIGSATHCNNAFRFLSERLSAIGLKINNTKSKIFCNDIDMHGDNLPVGIINRSTSGLIVLGTPIGTQEYVIRETMAAINNYTNILPLTLQFGAKIAFQLLRLCVSTRTNYLMRTVAPSAIEAAMLQFDDNIQRSLGVILRYQEHPLQPPTTIPELDRCPGLKGHGDLARSLPFHMGGIGIRHGDKVKVPAWISSWLKAMQWLEKSAPLLFAVVTPQLLSEQTLQALSIAKMTELDDRPISSIDDLYLVITQTVRATPTQKELTHILVDIPQNQCLKQVLAEPGKEETRAYHLSLANPHTHLWMSAGLSKNPRLKMSDEAFITNLGLRLLQPTSQVENLVGATCTCTRGDGRMRIPARDINYHAFSCGAKDQGHLYPGPQRVRYWRHNSIRDALIDFLHKACPGAQMMREPRLPVIQRPNHPAESLRADLSLRHDDTILYFDVVVTNPSSVNSLVRNHANNVPLAAAKAMETRKFQRYSEVYNAANGFEAIPRQLIPFSMETTGAFGPSAINSIEKLARFKEFAADPNPDLAYKDRPRIDSV